MLNVNLYSNYICIVLCTLCRRYENAINSEAGYPSVSGGSRGGQSGHMPPLQLSPGSATAILQMLRVPLLF